MGSCVYLSFCQLKLAQQVAGFSHNDVKIYVEDDVLYIKGEKPTNDDSGFHKRYPLSHLLDPSSIQASCADGILKVLVRRRFPETLTVPVAAQDPPAIDAANHSEHTKPHTVRLLVPGFKASDVKVEVDQENHLRITGQSSYGMGKLERVLRLPRDVLRDGVEGFLINGVLTVVAKKLVPEVHSVPLVEAKGDDASGVVELVKLAMPGVDKNSIKVELKVNRALETGHLYTKSESQNKTFEANLSLPWRQVKDVEVSSVVAELKDGLLIVSGKAKGEESSSRVDVKVGNEGLVLALTEGQEE